MVPLPTNLPGIDASLVLKSFIFPPALRGWINYYGKFSPHELNRICWQFYRYLVRWVQHKYKFMKRQCWATEWLIKQ
ncbi:group II intron maturase-specific domain-containing protein, partial [Vibrio parahaemolyticus]